MVAIRNAKIEIGGMVRAVDQNKVDRQRMVIQWRAFRAGTDQSERMKSSGTIMEEGVTKQGKYFGYVTQLQDDTVHKKSKNKK